MENREARRARRHVQRAHELLGFGLHQSQFGGTYDEIPGKVKAIFYEKLTYNQLKRQMAVSKGEYESVLEHIAYRKELLPEAIEQNEKNIIKRILEHNRFEDSPINEYVSIFGRAIQIGDLEVVKMLLEKGDVELNHTLSPERQYTMLYIAIQSYHDSREIKYLQIAKLLIESGCNPNSQTQFFFRPTSVFFYLINSIYEHVFDDDKADETYIKEVIDLVQCFLEKGARFSLAMWKTVIKGSKEFGIWNLEFGIY